VCLLATGPSLYAAPPIADVHVHYKWNQKEVTSAKRAVEILREHDVGLAVVIGTPADYALQLQSLAPEVVVPIWSPYREPGDWSRWAFDRDVLERARAALDTGHYRGIGELHLVGGFSPPWQSPVVSGLFQLAGEHGVPVMLHTELASNDYVMQLCQAFPEVKIVWAHAGAILTAAQVAAAMQTCPNLSADLAARDPWRFVNNPITDANGRLLPQWRALLKRFPDRFMVGSDPVWPVEQLDGWDQADTGWEEYARFLDFHRDWLQQLPASLAQKVRIDNARALFTTPRP